VDQAQATRLAETLKAAGLDVWWDALIEGGAAFAKSIEAALESCNAVVVMWSRTSVASDWVLDEAARGRDLRKPVPVSMDGTLPPTDSVSISPSTRRAEGDAAAPPSPRYHGIAAAGRSSMDRRPRQARPCANTASRRGVLIAPLVLGW
jgi:hypothetical protein